MKKSLKIILPIIILEIILSTIFYNIPVSCGRYGDTHSLLKPFGTKSPGMFLAVCVPRPHNDFFYPFADLLILTVVGYGIFLTTKKIYST